MLLELTTAMNLLFYSPSSRAQDTATPSASQTAPATPSALTTETTSAESDSNTKTNRTKKRKRRRRSSRSKSQASETSNARGKKLPAYQGSPKIESADVGPNANDESSEESAGTASTPSEIANTKSNSKSKKTRYKDPTEVPLPGSPAYGAVPANTPGKGEVSEADLAPGPIIKNPKVISNNIGEDGASELDPSERSFLRFGLHGGESTTKYRNFDSGAKEGALLVGAQMGLADDWWDHSSLFGIPLSGEENIRLDYVTSFDSGVAQMIQMRVDSILLLGSDLDNDHGLLPLVGLGVGWAKADFRTKVSSALTTHTKADGVIFVPQLGARWRFTDRMALDLKVEPLFATNSKLNSFGKLSAQLGFLVFL